MEIALRYKLLVNTLHTVYSVYSVFTVFISSTTNTVYTLYTYCWMVWASWEGFMAWWAKQDFICFESSNRRNFATQYLSYNKKNSISIKVGKLGAKKRTVGQSIGAELLKINIIFLKLKFSSIKILKITIRAYHYQPGLLPAKSFTGTNTQKGAHWDKPVCLQIHQSDIWCTKYHRWLVKKIKHHLWLAENRWSESGLVCSGRTKPV